MPALSRPTGPFRVTRFVDLFFLESPARPQPGMAPHPDLDSLAPARDFSRRAFVRTALGSGFAAAVLPVGAQTIRTDATGLAVGEVTIPSNGFRLPAYRAMPAGRTTDLPVVLVVSEVFGVHAHIADVARRFAKLGYLAIAPELFVRQGDPGSYGETARLLSEVVAKTPDPQVMADLDACIDWAGANGGDAHRLGITGFCWGGRIVWVYDAHTGEARRTPVMAGVAWYGRLVGTPTPLQPSNPLEHVAGLTGPVLGLYGAGWRRCIAWFRMHGVA
jgi:carboxymethylenebutenolidase